MSLSSRLYGSTTFTPKKTEQDLLKESAQAVFKTKKVEPTIVKPLVKTETKPVSKQTKKTPAYGTKGYIPKDLPVRANPFMELANIAALKLPENIVPGYKGAIEQARKESPVATTVAGIGGYLVPGAAGAKLVKPLLGKVGSKVAKNVAEGAIVGSGITAAENVVPLLKGEKDIKQVGKEIAIGAATGAIADVGLYGLGKLAKPLLAKIAKGQTLSKSEKQIVANQAKVTVDNVDKIVENYRKTIQEELGLPKETTAQQYKAQVEGQAYIDKLKKDTELALNQKNKQVMESFKEKQLTSIPKNVKFNKGDTVEAFGTKYTVTGRNEKGLEVLDSITQEKTFIPNVALPEVKNIGKDTKSHYSQRANEMLGDVDRAVKSDTIWIKNTGEGQNNSFDSEKTTRVKRLSEEWLSDLLNENNSDYDQIINALKRIKRGDSDSPMSARIKKMMDRDFEQGYFDKGTAIPPNKAFVETKGTSELLNDFVDANKIVKPLPNLKQRQPLLVKPLLSDTVTPQEQFKPLANVTPTKPPKKESTLAKALRVQEELQTGVKQTEQPLVKTTEVKPVNEAVKKLDADHQIELNRLKEIKARTTNKELIDSKIKSEGFRYAAERRQLIQGDSFEAVDGGLTPKELADKIKKEKTNYVGKSVLTPDGNGKVIGQSFGKVGVEFEDGTKKYFMADEIQPKFKPYEIKKQVVEDNVIKQQSEVAVKPTQRVFNESDAELGTNVNSFISQPVKSNLKTPEVGTSTSKFKETIMKSENVSKPIKDRIESIQKEFDLPTTSNEARFNVADKIVSEGFEEAVNLVKTGDKFESSVEQFIANRVVDRLNLEGRDEEAVEVLLNQAKKLRASGQEIQSATIWNKATPEGMQKWTLNTLKDTKMDSGKKKEIAINVGKRMKDLKDQTDPVELKKLVTKQVKGKTEKALLNKIINNVDDRNAIVNLATNQIINDVTGLSKSNSAVAGRMLSTGQAISHLLNATSTIGNLLGNASSMLSNALEKYPAAAVDALTSLATGKRMVSSKGIKPTLATKQAFAQAKQSAMEILAGAGNLSPDKDNLVITPAFKNVPIMRELEKALGLTLSTTDEFFKGMITADSMYNQLRARIGKESDKLDLDEIKNQVTPKEFQRALEEAKFVTFQNDSLPSTILTEVKNTLNRIGVGDSRSGGKFGVKDFGLGDLVIKYSRVPGNIIARTIDMTPVGYAKAIKLMTEIGDDPSKQREFSQAMGRATTGTGYTLAGMWLNKNGIIVGSDDKGSAREEQLKRSENLSGYKINKSALERLIKGESTELRKGDELSTFVWLGPVAAMLTMGAAVNQSMEKGDDLGDAYSKAQGKTFNQIMDLPSLYTAGKIYSELRKESEDTSVGGNAYRVAEVIASEALPGFVPSPIRQAAQGIDPVLRETKGKTVEETTKNKIKANIPILSKTLEPKITPTGEEAKRSAGVIRTFFDRGATEPYNPVAYTAKLGKIKELTGSASHYPITIAPSKIKVKNKEFELTPQEKTEYMKIVGKYTNEKYTQLLSSKNITTQKEAESISKRLSEIRSDATDKAKKEIIRKRQYL